DNAGKIGKSLAPFNPSNDFVIETALRFLEPGREDTIYDLGCGDGRFLIKAAECFGLRGVGIEHDIKYYERGLNAIKEKNLGSLISIFHGDILDFEFGQAKFIFLYLVPGGIRLIEDKLNTILRNGGRIVTYVFSIPGLMPVKTEMFKHTPVRLYTEASFDQPKTEK
ncbi:unnamed protein product, partial [Heterosigma akashiwo]